MKKAGCNVGINLDKIHSISVEKGFIINVQEVTKNIFRFFIFEQLINTDKFTVEFGICFTALLVDIDGELWLKYYGYNKQELVTLSGNKEDSEVFGKLTSTAESKVYDILSEESVSDMFDSFKVFLNEKCR